MELTSDGNLFLDDLPEPEPGRSDEQTVHLQAYKQHQETIKIFEKDLWATYGHLSAPDSRPLFTETWRRLEEAEGDERKKIEETWEALQWIDRSYQKEGLTEDLGYSAPWERLHCDSPGPFLSLGTHFWALVIGNNDYPDVPGAPVLGGCINDAHLVKEYLMKHLQVPEDHIVLLENACRNEMIDALYNLRDNETIPFGDNILIHYAGYGSSYDSGTQGPWDPYIGAICPIDRGCRGACDISERELDAILSELCAAKGPKITFISDCCYAGSGIRSDQEPEGAAFRVAPPIHDDNGVVRLNQMLKLGMDSPHRRSNVDLFSENWRRDLTSFVQLSPGSSTIEVDVGLGKGIHGLFTFAVIKALESEEGRGTTYEGVMQLIGRLREEQIPEAVGMRKASLLWFRDTAHMDIAYL